MFDFHASAFVPCIALVVACHGSDAKTPDPLWNDAYHAANAPIQAAYVRAKSLLDQGHLAQVDGNAKEAYSDARLAAAIVDRGLKEWPTYKQYYGKEEYVPNMGYRLDDHGPMVSEGETEARLKALGALARKTADDLWPKAKAEVLKGHESDPAPLLEFFRMNPSFAASDDGMDRRNKDSRSEPTRCFTSPTPDHLFMQNDVHLNTRTTCFFAKDGVVANVNEDRPAVHSSSGGSHTTVIIINH